MDDLAPQELAQLVEFAEAATIADAVKAAPPSLAEALGMDVRQIGGATASIMRGADVPLFNRVLGLGLTEPATEALLDEVLALYAPTGHRFMVQVSPAARPAALPAWLEARGFALRDNWAKCYRDTAPPPTIPTDLRIEQIGPADAGRFAEVGAGGFGMPPAFQPLFAASVGRPGWRHYLAHDGDTPVGCGALFVHDGVGALFGGATLPAARRRGAQGAIMARRIADAAALGCRWVVTETGEDTPANPNPSYHNMLRTGFRLAYLRPNYIYAPGAGS